MQIDKLFCCSFEKIMIFLWRHIDVNKVITKVKRNDFGKTKIRILFKLNRLLLKKEWWIESYKKCMNHFVNTSSIFSLKIYFLIKYIRKLVKIIRYLNYLWNASFIHKKSFFFFIFILDI